MDVLVHLARHPLKVVSKDELLDAVWPDTVIADDALFRYVSMLRRSLGDDPRDPRFIETIPKRGYRMIAPVSFEDAPNASAGGTTSRPPGQPGGRLNLRHLLPWGIAALASGIALASLLRQGESRPDERPDPSLSAPAVALSNDPRANELYLQSLSHGRDGDSNQRAIRVLEQAVELDPDFAPAWAALAERLTYDGAYGQGGEPALESALAANRRAAELAPELLSVPMRLVTTQAESGQLREAYNTARDLVGKYPHSAEAHFALSYVYRYAGLLEEATGECDLALSIAPNNYRFRSCAVVFMRTGHFVRAVDFIRLDQTSELGLYHQGYLYLHQGRIEDAERAWHRLREGSWAHGLLEACRERPESPDTRAFLERIEPTTVRDPEAWYFSALATNACGDGAAALRLLRSAVEKGYCAASAFESERFFANLSKLEEWSEVREEATKCRDEFIVYRTRHPVASVEPRLQITRSTD